MVVKGMNRLKRKPAPVAVVAAEPTKEEMLLMEIRDFLKARA